MSWKWYEINSYKASIGSRKGDYYGSVTLFGNNFFALIKFHKSDQLPDSTTSPRAGQRFYGHLDYQQMPTMIDLLRNEKPVFFGYYKKDINQFHVVTGEEPVGEGDGILAWSPA